MKTEISHYNWLDYNLKPFLTKIGVNTDYYNNGLISAHGDKCYGYSDKFEENGIHFFHGALLYLLTYISPYEKEVKETEKGWVDPSDWIVNNYPKYKKFLPKVFTIGRIINVPHGPYNYKFRIAELDKFGNPTILKLIIKNK